MQSGGRRHGKGHLVPNRRDGRLDGRAIDATGIQFNLLNRSRGRCGRLERRRTNPATVSGFAPRLSQSRISTGSSAGRAILLEVAESAAWREDGSKFFCRSGHHRNVPQRPGSSDRARPAGQWMNRPRRIWLSRSRLSASVGDGSRQDAASLGQEVDRLQGRRRSWVFVEPDDSGRISDLLRGQPSAHRSDRLPPAAHDGSRRPGRRSVKSRLSSAAQIAGLIATTARRSRTR